MSLESRLERLERRNRLLVGMLAVTASLAVGPWLMGAGDEGQPVDLIRTKRLVIVDEDGHGRGLWHVRKDGTCAMSIFGGSDDPRNQPSFSLVADEERADFTLGAESKGQITFGAGKGSAATVFVRGLEENTFIQGGLPLQFEK